MTLADSFNAGYAARSVAALDSELLKLRNATNLLGSSVALVAYLDGTRRNLSLVKRHMLFHWSFRSSSRQTPNHPLGPLVSIEDLSIDVFNLADSLEGIARVSACFTMSNIE